MHRHDSLDAWAVDRASFGQAESPGWPLPPEPPPSCGTCPLRAPSPTDIAPRRFPLDILTLVAQSDDSEGPREADDDSHQNAHTVADTASPDPRPGNPWGVSDNTPGTVERLRGEAEPPYRTTPCLGVSSASANPHAFEPRIAIAGESYPNPSASAAGQASFWVGTGNAGGTAASAASAAVAAAEAPAAAAAARQPFDFPSTGGTSPALALPDQPPHQPPHHSQYHSQY
mmetsp:Transcript_1619/g.5369  ORF Transcript_1619/g.5369 Transcript_1619/m.5369 type:complete len:229 (+) Transcript_1619:2512-3198(+)